MTYENSTEKLPKNAFFSAEEKVHLLRGKCPRNITKARLKEWLSYRRGGCKDGSARSDATKSELVLRVVGYIKNGWEHDYVPKWQQAPSVPASSSNKQTTTVEFPGSANWTSIRQAVNSVPSFSIQNVLTYFIERKAEDKESNNDFKNIANSAFALFRVGHIQKIELASDLDQVHFRCDCLPEMAKSKIYKLKLSLTKSGENEGEIVYASCICAAGLGPKGSCKHIASFCYALEEFCRMKSAREFESCTSRLQTWNQPRKRKLDPRSVYDIDFSKKIYRREERNATKPLNDPRPERFRNPNNTDQVSKELLDKIKEVKPNCAFFCLLSDEKLEPKEHEIISPIKEQPPSLNEILNRASRVKENLVVTDQERQKIARLTKAQSNSQEWYARRRVRITASKCKRAILKPCTSPTKAMREILHYNGQYQSSMMKQGIQDEKKILKQYENKMGCKVNETGFLISKGHPFLGASPDGVVDGGLVEIKRIFSNGLTLRKAVCKRGICKESCNGLVINMNHKFYYQVQLQMFCAECNWTDLVLSDINDLIIVHVKKCDHFLSSIIPKLEHFYDKHISLELAYPRVAYGLPRLSKLLNRAN